MLLPSLYRSGNFDRTWNVIHAGGYGAAIGMLAAIFKTLGPLRASAGADLISRLTEIALATLGFAVLCAAAALLRNYIAQRVVRHEG